MSFIKDKKICIPQKHIDKIELIFKIIYVFHIILCSNVYYYGTVLNTISSTVVIVLGASIICFRIFCYKNFTKYIYRPQLSC